MGGGESEATWGEQVQAKSGVRTSCTQPHHLTRLRLAWPIQWVVELSVTNVYRSNLVKLVGMWRGACQEL